MSQQVLDLRRSVQIVRRHRVLVGIVVALGLLVGGGYATLNPPSLTSTALVVLPKSVPSMATQVVIADSDAVLTGALSKLGPGTSLQKLRSEVQVRSLTSYIIAVSAKSRNAAEAKAVANAVATSYTAYVGAARSPVGHVPAQLLEPAKTATGSAPLKGLLVTGLLGALAGALIGVILSLAISRNDRRLRARDEIANSIGVPVLASFPVGHPSDPAGWTRLLEDYKPGAVPAWQMRTALHQLGMLGHPLGDSLDNGEIGRRSSLAVLSLATDRGAMALGPQLAAFAASLGIPSALVVGPQQDTTVTASLRTACAVPPPDSAKRPSQLRLTVVDGDLAGRVPEAALVVVVVVVDPRTPQIPDTVMRTTSTVLGVSAGAATAEQLARAAVSAAADGREVAGIIVADPEPTDRTTGRIPHLMRPARRKRPTRLRGLVTEIRR
jgi:capsular polysaccharide biosynthesis protein